MMWSISELKQRAKESVKQHYWWFVLACIILSVVGGGGGGSVNIPSGASSDSNYSSSDDDYYDYDDDYYDDDYYDDDYYSDDDSSSDLSSSVHSNLPVIGMILGVGAVILFVIFAIALVVSAFVFAPLRVGIYRFFMHAREGRRDFSDVGFVFGCGQYMNVVKIMFLASLKNTLWYLLFIIPGIVKSYEYRMIPYILSENPGIESKRVFEMTKAMTDGEKGSIWLLDLSFIGWNILSVFTCGILSVFWVNPYQQATFAELYATLREKSLQNGRVSSGELFEYYCMSNMNSYGGYNPNGYGQTVYDQNNFGQNNYNPNGYDSNNYNQNVYGQNGYDPNNYNQNGYGQTGYNQNNYNQNVYGQTGYDQNNYNQNNYGQIDSDQNVYDQNGFKQSDFDKSNFNQQDDNSENDSNNKYDL